MLLARQQAKINPTSCKIKLKLSIKLVFLVTESLDSLTSTPATPKATAAMVVPDEAIKLCRVGPQACPQVNPTVQNEVFSGQHEAGVFKIQSAVVRCPQH